MVDARSARSHSIAAGDAAARRIILASHLFPRPSGFPSPTNRPPLRVFFFASLFLLTLARHTTLVLTHDHFYNSPALLRSLIHSSSLCRFSFGGKTRPPSSHCSPAVGGAFFSCLFCCCCFILLEFTTARARPQSNLHTHTRVRTRLKRMREENKNEITLCASGSPRTHPWRQCVLC